MALTNTCLRFLIWAKQQGASFDSTLTLGHLDNLVSKEMISSIQNKHPTLVTSDLINWDDKYADTIFTALGAKIVESLDNSDYENASVLHDLNLPFPSQLNNSYSVVVDGGTLEHVFNFPQAISNCISALKPGGHFIGFSPANNLMGHGFYQFSPELFFRVFSEKNKFRIKGLFIIAAPFTTDTTTWFEVTDPDSIKDRVILNNKFPAYLMILAEKLGNTEMQSIFQSDYSEAWKQKIDPASYKPKSSASLKQSIKNVLGMNKDQEDLEKINPNYFKKRIIE